MSDDEAARAQRAAYLREQLAAHESYGNGDTPAAAAIRAEIAELEPPNLATGGVLPAGGVTVVGEDRTRRPKRER